MDRCANPPLPSFSLLAHPNTVSRWHLSLSLSLSLSNRDSYAKLEKVGACAVFFPSPPSPSSALAPRSAHRVIIQAKVRCASKRFCVEKKTPRRSRRALLMRDDRHVRRRVQGQGRQHEPDRRAQEDPARGGGRGRAEHRHPRDLAPQGAQGRQYRPVRARWHESSPEKSLFYLFGGFFFTLHAGCWTSSTRIKSSTSCSSSSTST